MPKTTQSSRRLPRISFGSRETHDHDLSGYCTFCGTVSVRKGTQENTNEQFTWGLICGVSQDAYIKAFLAAAKKTGIAVGDRLRDQSTEVTYKVLSLDASDKKWLVWVPRKLQRSLKAIDNTFGVPGWPNYYARKKANCLLAVVGWRRLHTRETILPNPEMVRRCRRKIAKLRKRTGFPVTTMKTIHHLHRIIRDASRKLHFTTPLSRGLIP